MVGECHLKSVSDTAEVQQMPPNQISPGKSNSNHATSHFVVKWPKICGASIFISNYMEDLFVTLCLQNLRVLLGV